MAKATVGTALHYLSQHTELDARTERGSPGRGEKQIDPTRPTMARNKASELCL